MATSLAQNKTLKRLELGSDSLTQYKDAKLFTQHLMLGAAGSTALTEACIEFSSWWRDCHIQSGHVAGGVQMVTMHGTPLDVLCDMLPVFEPVEQLVCLDIRHPQESNMTMAALKLIIEVEQALTGSTQLKRILFDCCCLVEQLVCLDIKDPQEQSTPEWFFSLCISSLLKGAARSKSITSVQLAHSEEHQQHVEEVLTYLLTDLLLKREGGFGRVSVPLKLDWSVPASKSSQSQAVGRASKVLQKVLLFCQRRGGTALTKLRSIPMNHTHTACNGARGQWWLDDGSAVMTMLLMMAVKIRDTTLDHITSSASPPP